MANHVRKVAEVQETTWTQETGRIITGAAIMILAGGLIYASKYLFNGTSLVTARVIFGLVALGGFGLLGAAVYNGLQTRNMAGFDYACPYCDRPNKLEAEPNESFDCEFCNRTIHFEDGLPLAVRTVSCPFCQTEHRVAINVQRYVCDRCNRPLELTTQAAPGAPAAKVAQAEAPAAMYDVLLLAADRRREIEIAMKLQNLLVVNLPEARRLMATASTATPLVVSHAVPQRKAEAIRRQLQDVGATASLRPTGETGAAGRAS